MALLGKEDIEILINGQKSAISNYTRFAVGIFLFGIFLLPLSGFISDREMIKTIIDLAGVFISTLSSYPIKEIMNKNDKIEALKILKSQIIKIQELGDQIDIMDKQRNTELIWKVLEKTALN
jgi:hypothetical protein